MKPIIVLMLLALTCGICRAQNGTTVWDAQGNYSCPAGKQCKVPSNTEIAQHRGAGDKTVLGWGQSIGPSFVGPGSVLHVPPVPTWSESMKEDGSYAATFSDPLGVWRCYMTSVTLDDPRNVFGSEASTLTITCVKPHPVKP